MNEAKNPNTNLRDEAQAENRNMKWKNWCVGFNAWGLFV